MWLLNNKIVGGIESKERKEYDKRDAEVSTDTGTAFECPYKRSFPAPL